MTVDTHSNEACQITDDILEFIASTGLFVVERQLVQKTFLPGILIDQGTIVVDRAALRFPGDLLHEAGHLAVALPSERSQFHETFGDDGGMEMAAIAWSYAASVHLRLPLDLLFHEHGYRGDAMWLREHFSSLRSLGVPMLIWRQMTIATEYPAMRRWTAPELTMAC